MDLSKAVLKAQKAILEKGDSGVYALAADCKDELPDCKNWADLGECKKNPDFMLARCPRSCGRCTIDIADNYGAKTVNASTGDNAESSGKVKTATGIVVGHAVQKQEKGHVVVEVAGDKIKRASVEKRSDALSHVQIKPQSDENKGRHTDAKVHMNPDEKKELVGNHAMANPDEKKQADGISSSQTTKDNVTDLKATDAKVTNTPSPTESSEVKFIPLVTQSPDLDQRKNEDKSQASRILPEVIGAKIANNSISALVTGAIEKAKDTAVKSVTDSQALVMKKEIKEEIKEGTKEEIKDSGVGVQDIADVFKTREPECVDEDAGCPMWAASGECEKNIKFMLTKCRKSCKACVVKGTSQEDLAK